MQCYCYRNFCSARPLNPLRRGVYVPLHLLYTSRVLYGNCFAHKLNRTRRTSSSNASYINGRVQKKKIRQFIRTTPFQWIHDERIADGSNNNNTIRTKKKCFPQIIISWLLFWIISGVGCIFIYMQVYIHIWAASSSDQLYIENISHIAPSTSYMYRKI